MQYNQGCESSEILFIHNILPYISLISDFFALHKPPFSDFKCIEKHIFSGISDYFRLFLTDALTSLYNDTIMSERKPKTSSKSIPVFFLLFVDVSYRSWDEWK